MVCGVLDRDWLESINDHESRICRIEHNLTSYALKITLSIVNKDNACTLPIKRQSFSSLLTEIRPGRFYGGTLSIIYPSQASSGSQKTSSSTGVFTYSSLSLSSICVNSSETFHYNDYGGQRYRVRALWELRGGAQACAGRSQPETRPNSGACRRAPKVCCETRRAIT